jgi:hypothetical protein
MRVEVSDWVVTHHTVTVLWYQIFEWKMYKRPVFGMVGY